MPSSEEHMPGNQPVQTKHVLLVHERVHVKNYKGKSHWILLPGHG